MPSEFTGIPLPETKPAAHATRDAASAWLVLLAIMAVASAVVLPSLFLGHFSGHDFEFHVASWMDVSRQWHEGVWFPRWSAWANYGFGEPRFVFYPPVSWLLGAALGQALPWRAVPGAMTWIGVVFAAVSMLRLAREWLPPREATLAAVVYAANPYHLVVIYYRSDFAELLASAAFPLLIQFVLRLGREGSKAIAPLAIVYAAIWLANAPAGVIAFYTLVLLLVAVAATRKSLPILGWGAAAIALGFLLAAFYLVPAAYEQRWVDIGQALSSGLGPEENFFFAHTVDAAHDEFNFLLSVIAVGELAVGAMAVLLFDWRRQRARESQAALASLTLLSLALMLPMSKLAWRYLPELRFVQFPWRWLIPFSLAFAIFCAAAFGRWRAKWAGPALMLAALLALGGWLATHAWRDSEDVPNLFAAVRSARGYFGADEYTPLGCDHYDLPQDSPRVAVDSNGQADVEVHVMRWAPEEKILTVDALQPATLALRLVNYPAWRAVVNGRNGPIRARVGTAQMLLAVPAGKSFIQVRFVRTLDRTLGAALSILGLAACGGLAFRQRPR